MKKNITVICWFYLFLQDCPVRHMLGVCRWHHKCITFCFKQLACSFHWFMEELHHKQKCIVFFFLNIVIFCRLKQIVWQIENRLKFTRPLYGYSAEIHPRSTQPCRGTQAWMLLSHISLLFFFCRHLLYKTIF